MGSLELIREFVKTTIQERLDRLKGVELQKAIKDELIGSFEKLDAFQPSSKGTEQEARSLFVSPAVWDDGTPNVHSYGSSKANVTVDLAYFSPDLWDDLIATIKEVVLQLSDRIGWRVVTFIPRGFRWDQPQVQIVLEPIHDEETEAAASRISRVFYHITDQSNVSSILSKGLIPKTSTGATSTKEKLPRDQVWTYTPRTYVMTNKANVKEMLQSGIFLSSERTPIVLAIKTSLVPKDVKFYSDKEASSEERYFWTDGVIPPSCISIPEQKGFWLPADWRFVRDKLKYGISPEK